MKPTSSPHATSGMAWRRRPTARLPKCIAAALLALGLLAAPAVHAAITSTGTVVIDDGTGTYPAADPSTWTSSTTGVIGQGSSAGYVTVDGSGTTVTVGTLWVSMGNASSTLDITNGGAVNVAGTLNLNFYRGTNVVTVDGAGSSLTVGGRLYLGNTSYATLNIYNGATVAVIGELYCGNISSTINFGANGGTLTAPSLPSTLPTAQYSGTGTIRTTGFIGDFGNLLLDATHTPTWTTATTWTGTAYDGTTQNIAIQIDPMAGGNIAVGYQNAGSLTIRDGRTLTSSTSYVGHLAGSTGTVTVDGAGSTWTNTGTLYVGNSGTGTMSITNGGSVASAGAAIGAAAGSNGTVTVDGAGSTWTSSGSLTIGNAGSGKLNIANGGAVSVTGDTIVGPLGSIKFDGSGGTLTTGTLYAGAPQFSGNGTINTSGIVGDVDLVFDASRGTTQSFAVNGTTVNLSQSSSKALGAGYIGSGTLTIKDGVSVASSSGYLGYNSGSTGVATVTGTGSAWVNSGTQYVGYNGIGTMSITEGASVSNANAYLGNGYGTGSNGTVTVDGAGSTWTNTGTLYVADSGTGRLNITNGASVTSANAYVGHYYDSNGAVTIDGARSTWTNTGALYVGNADDSTNGRLGITNGGTLTTGTLYAGASQLSGNGTINTSGIVGDMDIVFDASHGATHSFAVNGLTVNLAQSSANALGAGYIGSGTLAVRDGVSVASNTGYLGYNKDSAGTATISGTGSTWTNSGTFYVGNNGTGTMNIASGGKATGTVGYLGYNTGSRGTVNVDGAGSTWTNSGILYVGRSGTGRMSITNGGAVGNANAYIGYGSNPTSSVVTVDGANSKWTSNGTLYVGRSSGGTNPRLSISDGGAVSATAVSFFSGSMITIDVNSSLKVGATGTGTLANNGTTRLVAGAGAASGTYTPMAYGTRSGKVPQALGGIWNDTAHTVTVADAIGATGAGGASTAPFDLASYQRALITDSATGKSAGAGFLGTTTSTTIGFTATAITGSELGSLQSLITGTGKGLLSGWDFSTTGYTPSSTSPVYSLPVGRYRDGSLRPHHLAL